MNKLNDWQAEVGKLGLILLLNDTCQLWVNFGVSNSFYPRLHCFCGQNCLFMDLLIGSAFHFISLNFFAFMLTQNVNANRKSLARLNVVVLCISVKNLFKTCCLLEFQEILFGLIPFVAKVRKFVLLHFNLAL